MTTFSRLQQLLANVGCRKPSRIEPSTRLQQDLGFDSLDFIELVLEVETEFDVRLPDGRLPTIRTVQDLLGLIDTLRGPD